MTREEQIVACAPYDVLCRWGAHARRTGQPVFIGYAYNRRHPFFDPGHCVSVPVDELEQMVNDRLALYEHPRDAAFAVDLHGQQAWLCTQTHTTAWVVHLGSRPRPAEDALAVCQYPCDALRMALQWLSQQRFASLNEAQNRVANLASASQLRWEDESPW
jgi:hypothetical protein